MFNFILRINLKGPLCVLMMSIFSLKVELNVYNFVGRVLAHIVMTIYLHKYTAYMTVNMLEAFFFLFGVCCMFSCLGCRCFEAAFKHFTIYHKTCMMNRRFKQPQWSPRSHDPLPLLYACSKVQACSDKLSFTISTGKVCFMFCDSERFRGWILLRVTQFCSISESKLNEQNSPVI